MPRLLCVKDQINLRPHKNETYVIEMAHFGPCKIWMADTWKCPACGIEVVAGFGEKPISEHFQDNFGKWIEQITTDKERVEYDYEYPRKEEATP